MQCTACKLLLSASLRNACWSERHCSARAFFATALADFSLSCTTQPPRQSRHCAEDLQAEGGWDHLLWSLSDRRTWRISPILWLSCPKAATLHHSRCLRQSSCLPPHPTFTTFEPCSLSSHRIVLRNGCPHIKRLAPLLMELTCWDEGRVFGCLHHVRSPHFARVALLALASGARPPPTVPICSKSVTLQLARSFASLAAACSRGHMLAIPNHAHEVVTRPPLLVVARVVWHSTAHCQLALFLHYPSLSFSLLFLVFCVFLVCL